MTEQNLPPPDSVNAASAPEEQDDEVSLAQWALAILLTMLVGLSAAALLSTSVMEMLFDSASAWIRLGVLLPVLLIATYLLVQTWRNLFSRHGAGKK